MKKIIVFLLLSLAIPKVWADEGVALLLKSDSTVCFAFSESPVIVFGKQFSMHTTNQTVTYPFEKIQRIFLSNDITPSVVENINTENSKKLSFRFANGQIEIRGLHKGEYVSLYTKDGIMLCSQKKTSDNTTFTLPIPQGQGIFIIKTSTGISYKCISK